MPTGPLHHRVTLETNPTTGERTIVDGVECRCTIGEMHEENGAVFRDEDFGGDDESLSVYDAADIWLSSGMEEGQMFGYSEDELRRAAGES